MHAPTPILSALCFCALASACGDGPPSPQDTDTMALVPAPPEIEALPSEGCRPDGIGAGEYEFSIEWEGRQREYFVHVPEGYDAATPMPLVLDIHPLTQTASAERGFTRSDEVADARGYVVVYPNSDNGAWNAGPNCCSALVGDRDPPDDVAFMVDLVERVSADLCVDRRRVYSMGFSNGGWISHTMACKRSEVFAAIAPCCGVLPIPYDECTPSQGTAVYHIHGEQDQVEPYAGNALLGFKPVVEVVEFWADTHGCNPEPQELEGWGTYTCNTYPQCDAGAEVTLCTDPAGGHMWPGKVATEAAFDFFGRHALQ